MEFNACFKQVTEKTGEYFVDIWEGFVDEASNSPLSGYDVNGQTTRLRANDGINFTPSGRAKLTFYAEQAIHRSFPVAYFRQTSPGRIGCSHTARQHPAHRASRFMG